MSGVSWEYRVDWMMHPEDQTTRYDAFFCPDGTIVIEQNTSNSYTGKDEIFTLVSRKGTEEELIELLSVAHTLI